MKLTKYSQLEHGRRVRGMRDSTVFTDAKLSVDNNGDVHVCQNVYNGANAENKLGYRFSFFLCGKNDNLEEWTTNQLLTVEDDELVVEEGDLLVDGDGYYRRVLGVCGCVAILSEFDRDKNSVELRVSDSVQSFYQLKQSVYKIVDEEEPETTEMDGKKYIKKENDDGTITLIPA